MTCLGQPTHVPARAHNPQSVALFFVLLFVALASSRMNGAAPAINAGTAPVKSAARAARATAMAMLPQEAQQGPRIWLGERKPLAANYVGAPQSVSAQSGVARPGQNVAPTQQAPEQALASGQAVPLAMVSGDFDHDGFSDLAVGYSAPGGGIVAIHRGNMDAFAPQSQESWLAIGRGDFPSPFLPDVKVFSVPVSPDFLAVGKFTSTNGFDDLLVAARGGSVLYVFPGNGDGTFGDPQTLSLTGGVTALTAGDLGHARAFGSVIVGLSAGSTSALQVLRGSKDGLVSLTVFRLKGPASSIVFGEFGDPHDVAFLAGGQVSILRPSLQIVPVSLPVSVSAIAPGRFLFDRNAGDQIAVLASDGSVHIAARSEFDPRTYTSDEFRSIRQATLNHQEVPLAPKPSFAGNGWKIVESLAAVGSVTPGQSPVFFRARVLNNGADDVMWLNNSGQMAVISHPDSQPGETFAPAQISIRPYSGTPVHAITQRVNVDHRPGVITIHRGEVGPSALMPLPDPTFFPNRFDDITPRGTANSCLNTAGVDGSGDCTLREAILKANGDTVMVQAGTYTLTIAKVANDCTGNFGALSADRSMTIVGAGQNTTIIQAGTTAYNAGTPNGVDMVMNVNEDLATAGCPVTNASASISNLTLQNGHNRGTHGNDGDGGCMEFDTGSSGNATLALTNVTLQNCDTTQGNGGGLASFNFVVNGPGMPTITSSIIQGNKGVDSVGGGSTGGGIWVSVPSRMLMSSSQVMNNTVPTGVGLGGGISVLSNVSGSRQTIIHSSTISGNTANGSGGGIFATANLLVDQGTTISGNTAGVGNIVNSTDGGGLFLNTKNPDSVTLSKVTITGNHAPNGNGGGISDGNLSAGFGTLTLQFSRLAGNTAGGSGSNLNNIDGTVTATNNWWGTNAAASTIRNDAGGATPTTATFDPFIVLTHQANPAKIRINQSTTLTGDMSKDNHGNGAALAGNLNQIVGLPIRFDAAVLGTIPQVQPETLNASAQATATFNAGNIGGLGSANATVDQAVVPANSNLVASATESGTTATITTVGVHGFVSGQQVTISGVGVGGYNGTFIIGTAPTSTTFTYTTTAGLASSSGGTASIGIVILQPPVISKSFSPTTIKVGGTSTITFSITNGNVVTINSSFTDDLTSGATVTGLVVAASPNIVNGCGGTGTVTAVAGASSISYSNPALPKGSTPCLISVDVTGTTDGIKPNSVTIDSTDAGNGNTATASPSLKVINPPTISKVFGASTIPLNGTTSLTFTITNPNSDPASALNGIAFTDSLPAGMIVATPNGLSNTCSTSPTATAGLGTISLTGASLAAGAQCTISVNIQGTTAGLKSNSVTVTDTVAGTGNTSSASLTVVAPPTISKAFGAASIPLNGTTSLTFTVTNPNTATALTGIAFSDTVPANLQMIGFGSAGDTCNSVTSPGSSTVNYSGISVAANSSCTLTVTVKGIAAGDALNTTSAITSTEGGTGTTSNTATLTVVAPPTIAKVFNPASIALNATTSLQFTITNPVANTVALTGVAFSDTLPAGLTVANTSATVCGGTLTTTAPTGITLTGATIAVNSQCVFSVTVTGATAGQYTNTTGSVSSTNGGTGNTASANLTVVAPATITKSFNPTSIAVNTNSTLSFTITNPNTASSLSGVAFTDNLPAGLMVAATPNVTGSCGSGTITATAGSGSISLSGGTLTASPAAGSSCTFSVAVTGTTAGVKNNSVQVTSTEGGTGNTSNASLTVVGPATISKSFNPASIALNTNSTLSFTITNPNTASALSGVAFTDNLPAGVVVAATPNITGSCGSGTITATAGSGTITLSGGTLTASPGAGSSCTFSVDVTGTTAGSKSNTTGAVSSTEGGTGATSNTAVLAVVAPPSIAKIFNPASISLNATTSLQFTITNPAANSVALTGVAFSDTLPAGLTVANASATVCGGTLTTTAPTGITLTGATIAVNSQCVFNVTVTGAVSGQYTNTTGPVSSTNGGTGNTASANLTVAAAPTITKSFNPTQIAVNTNSTLSFTISNPNTNVALSGVAFTDSLPAGLVVAATPNVTGSCGSGTITATAGSGSISLSGGTLTASPAAGSSCTFSVAVTGTTAGVKNNSVQVTSTEGGTGNTSNASLTVVGPATISKSFNPTSIVLNTNSTLSFTITNPNTASALSGVAFTDNLPAGVVVAATPNITGSCGSGTITATAGSGTITLSGGTLTASPGAGSSCTFSVDVTGTTAGSKSNTTGAVSSTEGGTGATSNTAVLTVVAAPSIAKIFNPASISLNATTSLQFTITNPAANTAALTGVAFSDTLPAGLTVANASATVCGGILTTTAPTGITLTGATIAVNSQCVFNVTVTGAVSGQYTNTTGPVSSTNGGTGNTASANLTVAAAPVISKSFNPTQIAVNTSSTLSFTISNPNTNVALSGVAFTDSLPAGLVVAATPNVTGSCGSGTITATAGSGSISLSGGTLTASPAAGSSCTFSVAVTGTTAGVKNNSVQVTSTEGGTGNTSNASITVVAPPQLTKFFGAASIPLNGSTTLSFTVNNPNSTVGLSGIAFSDTLPAGLQLSSTTVTGSCGSGTITPVVGAPSSISLSGGILAASGSCTFSVNVTGTVVGTQNNTTGAVTSTEGGTGGTASSSIDVVAPPVIAKAFNPVGIQPNGVSTLTVTITNPAANTVPLQGVAFTDNFPANLVVATPNGLNNTCGGTATATAGSSTVSLTGGTIPVSNSCTVTVNVTSSFTGSYLNSTGPVSSTNGGAGGAASATLLVALPPTISKLFVPDTIFLGGKTEVSFTITNPNSNSTPPNNDVMLTGITFTDALPSGLTVAATPDVSNTCGGTLTAVPGSTSITLTGGALAPAVGLRPQRGGRTIRSLGQPVANGSCFISVSVTPASTGTFNNTTGAISANESGQGAISNTATLTVNTPPTPPALAKVFGAPSIPLNATTSLNFTVTNANASLQLANLSFSDSLPAGLVVAAPNGVTGTCVTSDGANVQANPTSGSIIVSGLNLPGNSSCMLSLNVTGTSAGTKNNVTSNITGTFDDGSGTSVSITGNAASASTVVVAPPSISKAFVPVLIGVNGTSTLSFTITNPAVNAVAQAGVAVTDTLPANLVVATPNGLTSSCGGTVTATAGSGSIVLTNGSIGVNSSCTFSVNVTSAVAGTYNNVSGSVSSTNGGTGNTAAASLIVKPASLSITKTHAGNLSRGQIGAIYTITVSNAANVGPTVGTVTVTDTLPPRMTATSMSGPGWTCVLATTTCTRSDALAPGASYPPITLVVNLAINISGNIVNTATVSGGGDPNSHTAMDASHVGPPLDIFLTTPPDNNVTINAGGTAQYVFTVDANGGGLGGINFSAQGLPPGATVTFDKQGETLPETQVTMTITTVGPTAAATPLRGTGGSSLYAAMLLPSFGMGLVLLGRGKKTAQGKKLRLLLLAGFLLMLLLAAGCGGHAGNGGGGGTPAGSYAVSITATSSAQPDIQATTSVNLTVR